MGNNRLYNVAKRYTQVIEAIERTRDPEQLVDLEEERAEWHHKLIIELRRRKIRFKDREHVTTLAFRLVRLSE